MDGDKSVRGGDLHSPVGQEGLADTDRPGADIKPAEDKDTHLVLIVDDDASFVEAAAVFLGSHGYETAKTYSGMQAVCEVRERPVDVAIIDLYLPDISGVLVARALRRLRPAAVVIMISGDDSDEARQRCMGAGAWSFLAKPLQPRELLSRIRKSLDLG